MTPFARGVRAGLEAAAGVASMWSEENFRLAGDTIHLDPFLHGDLSEQAALKSMELTDQGADFAARAHAAQDIAAAIRSIDPTTIKDPGHE
jgi:hypothetical protein